MSFIQNRARMKVAKQNKTAGTVFRPGVRQNRALYANRLVTVPRCGLAKNRERLFWFQFAPP
jgi:aminoglycoside phosphotransferase